MIAENVLADSMLYSGPPGMVLIDPLIFNLFVIGGMLALMLFVLLLLGLITNRESWFWFWMRWSGKIAIAEFDDTGKVTFKKEKSIGQGVVKGETDDRDYSVTPRNISDDIEPFIREETNRRFESQVKEYELRRLKEPGEENPAIERVELHNKIRAQVSEEYSGVTEALKVATDINRFRAWTSGIKTPFFVRYSGKAVVVNPLTAVVISGGKYARVVDLKTFMGKMITPSQIKYIATLSEMIGAKQLKQGGGLLGTILIIAGIFAVLLLVVFYGLPAMGIKVF